MWSIQLTYNSEINLLDNKTNMCNQKVKQIPFEAYKLYATLFTAHSARFAWLHLHYQIYKQTDDKAGLNYGSPLKQIKQGTPLHLNFMASCFSWKQPDTTIQDALIFTWRIFHNIHTWLPTLVPYSKFQLPWCLTKKKNFFFAASPSPSIWLEFLIDVIGFDWRSLSRWEISKHHLDAFGKEEGEAMSTCDVIEVRGR